MYWFRAEGPIVIFLWLSIAAVWITGGWLIATHAFRLERWERLLVGFGIGLACYLWFINLIGRWLAPELAFSLAAFLVVMVGVAFAWRGERPWLNRGDLSIWGWMVAGLLLFFVLTRIAMGLGIFDDRKNLSIVSTMASGDIPPHHYMNSASNFVYHYGFQLLGASLMRLGGLLPWSAYDLSKSLNGAYLFVLIGLFARRYVQQPLSAVLVPLIMAFAMGTRYLLYFAPHKLMVLIDILVKVRALDEVVGMPVSQAIQQGIVLKDGPPAPFLYGFMSGIGSPLILSVNVGPSTFSFSLFLLIWVLAPRLTRPAGLLILTILFAMWGMSWEASYGLFALAGLIVGVYWLLKRRNVLEPWVKWMLAALLLSIPIVLLQGGTITEIVREMWMGLSSAGGNSGISSGGFSLRSPPAVYSSHLGALEITSPIELFVAILEMGTIVLFAPLLTWWAWKRFRQGDWMLGTVVLSAWLGILLPIIFSYEYDRDISRFTRYGTLVWTLVLAVMLFDSLEKHSKYLGGLIMAGIALAVFGGILISGTELSAASQVVLTEEGITGLDASMAETMWDQLPRESEVFDPYTWRATMVTGRLTRVVGGKMSFDYEISPTWEALKANPTASNLLANGFTYVYVDEEWWNAIPEASRESLSATCVTVIADQEDPETGQFRQLIDLGQCEP